MGRRQGIREVKARRQEKRRRARRRRRALFLTTEVLILLILLGIGYVMLKYDKFQIHTFGEGELQVNDGVEKKGYTTLALFGGDSREGVLDAGTHSDTIIIASINNQTKEVKMVSVYRDTLTEQMDGGLHKANHAYFSGGPKEAINMLNKNFDLDIQGYAAVDFKALADAIDLLGGIELDVSEEEAAEMNRYIKETGSVVGKKAIAVSAGKQKLDGVQAVTYARIRKNVGGDYKRTDRQREVIAEVVKKAGSTDLVTLNSIIDEVFSQVSTSLTMKELLTMASGITKYQLGESKGFPFEMADGRVNPAGSVIVPLGLAENVQELHAFLYSDTEYTVSETVKGIGTSIETVTGFTRADYAP